MTKFIKINTVRKCINTRTGDFSYLISNEENRLCPIDEIAYLHAKNAVVWALMTDGRSRLINATLSKLHETLKNEGFVRVSRSFLVSKKHIVELKVERHNESLKSKQEGSGGYLLIKCKVKCERTFKKSDFHIIPLSRRARRLNLSVS